MLFSDDIRQLVVRNNFFNLIIIIGHQHLDALMIQSKIFLTTLARTFWPSLISCRNDKPISSSGVKRGKCTGTS